MVSTLGRALELVSKFTGLPVPTSPFNLEGGVEGAAEGDDAEESADPGDTLWERFRAYPPPSSALRPPPGGGKQRWSCVPTEPHRHDEIALFGLAWPVAVGARVVFSCV